MDSKVERQREHFDSIADEYLEARLNATHRDLKKRIWSAFSANKKALLASGARVLEPMCGMAEGLEIVETYFQSEIDYLGFDYSEKMVAAARRRLPKHQIEWADVTVFDPKDKQYDFIVLLGGLHHVYAVSDKVVMRLADSLAPGGYFLSYEPTQNCWLTRKIREKIYSANPTFDHKTEQGFDLEQLNTMFRQAGFDLIDQAYPGLLSYILYYNPDAFPWLNKGGVPGVKAAFSIDRLFWRNWIGRKLSFATLSLWRKRV
ncbi:MAG: methyltransferase domain-containing protein [Zoogloeaceae bacterium]|jgi:SAM-dependent methyltransferase|nr:methyltransferase domain-containing protein [Zoogloeaceae bacterium]